MASIKWDTGDSILRNRNLLKTDVNRLPMQVFKAASARCSAVTEVPKETGIPYEVDRKIALSLGLGIRDLGEYRQLCTDRPLGLRLT
jgi:hypothetical protein